MVDPIENNLSIFFRDPNEIPYELGTLGVLYLLRRDVNHCIHNSILLFPGHMTMLAGIDLLGKFYAGSDDKGEVRDRFRNFIIK